MTAKPGIDKEFKRRFNKAFCARVRAARINSGLTQKQVATALGIEKDTYKQYELRSPLPGYLIERFCIVVREDAYFIMFGARREMTLPKTQFPIKDAK